VNASHLSSSSSRFASSLVVAEHEEGKLTTGTLSAISAAQKIGGDVSVLVVGKNVAEVAASASKVNNVQKVLTVDHAAFEHILAEDMAPVLKDVAQNYTHVIAPSSNVSKNYIPRAAALVDSAPVTDILSVIDEATFTRPVYAGNAIATVKMSDKIKFVLVRTTAFEKAATGAGTAAIEAVNVGSLSKSAASTFVSANVSKSDRPDLASARIVVSGGRGLKSGENFKILEALADKLGGAVGASRAAVDAGYVPNEYQVGQTGKVVAPDLYIAVGISGAIQHLSGMKDSKTIVAINKDKDAPIFQVADYGLVEDLFKAVPEMTSKL
jgi:electron transfer flavoprotein alpha subunit